MWNKTFSPAPAKPLCQGFAKHGASKCWHTGTGASLDHPHLTLHNKKPMNLHSENLQQFWFPFCAEMFIPGTAPRGISDNNNYILSTPRGISARDKIFYQLLVWDFFFNLWPQIQHSHSNKAVTEHSLHFSRCSIEGKALKGVELQISWWTAIDLSQLLKSSLEDTGYLSCMKHTKEKD